MPVAKQLKEDMTIAENLRNPLIGGLVRQDSGDMRAFVDNYFSPPVRLSPSMKWEPSEGYKCLASEINSDADVQKVGEIGYMAIGTGGYFGEKPWTKKEGELTGSIDLVAKVSKVQLGEKSFFPVKLGDYGILGEWHLEKPGKFAVSSEIEGGDDKLFQRWKRQGEVPTG